MDERVNHWRHLTRDEMGGYDFEMYEKRVGSRWASVTYDYGHMTHPNGDEMTMENIDEFVQEYPAGYYWSGHDKTRPHIPDDLPHGYGGPFKTAAEAKAEADDFLKGKVAVPA